MDDVMDEGELIRRIVSGEKERFRDLVLRYQDRIYATILRQVGDPHTAEELAQESFIKAYKHLKSFQGNAAFSTWLTRIALNHTYSYLSSRKYRNKILTDEFIPGQHDTNNNIFTDNLETKELLKAFYKCFSQLSEKFQAVLTLCALEEKNYDECAAIVRIPVGTVRSRLHKARELVTTCMEGSNHG